MLALLGKTGVIDDPCHHWSLFLHGGQHLSAHLLQHGLIAPWSLGYHMMQTLTHWLHISGIQTGGHRLDALALPGQQQAHAVILQRRMPVQMFRGLRQAFHIRRETLLLWAWRR
jgi:hypothetical protein